MAPGLGLPSFFMGGGGALFLTSQDSTATALRLFPCCLTRWPGGPMPFTIYEKNVNGDKSDFYNVFIRSMTASITPNSPIDIASRAMGPVT